MTPCIRVEEYAVGLDQPGSEEHLRECARCREALARVRKIEETLRSAVADEEPVSAAEVRAGLELATERLSRKNRWKEVLPMAAAAAILLGIVAWVSGVFAPKPIPPRPEPAPAVQDPKEQNERKTKLAALDEAIRKTPGNATLYLDRAKVRLELEDAAGGVSDCSRAIELDPTLLAAYLGRAEARVRFCQRGPHRGKVEGVWQGALEDCDQAIRLEPTRAESLLVRGRVRIAMAEDRQEEQKDPTHVYEAALQDFEEAIRLEPKSVEAYFRRGLAFRALADFDAAITDLSQALKLAPRDWPHRADAEKALANLDAQYAQERDKLRAKLAALDGAIRLTPAKAPLYLERAEVRLRLNDAPAAIEDCSKAIELDPKNPEGYEKRAESRLRFTRWGPHLGKIEGVLRSAIEDCDQALRLDPHRAETYKIRGWLHRELERVEEATADFRKALELAPPEWPHREELQKAIADLSPQLKIEGKITAVSDPFKLVILNLGKEHGVRVGDEFTVYRDGAFIATVQIERVDRAWAAGRVVKQKENESPRVADSVSGTRTSSDRGAVRLVYRVEFPEGFRGDRNKTVRETEEILSRRLNLIGLKNAATSVVEGDDRILITLPGEVTVSDLDGYKKLFSTVGRLELRALAPEEMSAMKELPRGYEAIPWQGGRVVVATEPIVTNSDIRSASVSGDFLRVVDFELTPEGAEKLDEAAQALFAREPRGKIGILYDGTLFAVPTVNTPNLGGKGVIAWNFSAQEAERLAILLRSGCLPMPLKLESEKFEGPK